MPAKMVGVPAATRGDVGSGFAIAGAPAAAATPLPEGFGLIMDPSTATFDGGRVMMGGSPLRLLRLSRRACALTDAWNRGTTVSGRRSEQLLARRLVSSGVFLPRPRSATFAARDVTVVVPVRDRPEQLARLLARLEGLSCIVVDDASTDAALTEEITRRAGASFIGLPVNRGPSSARNRGLAAASTPLVAFVDSDCIPSDGWLGPLLGYFDDPLVALVAPRVVPAPAYNTLTRYEGLRSPLDMGAAEGLVRPLSRIPYVPGAAIVIRRAVAGHLLFDPEMRGGEDVDLVWRLCAAGWDVRYVPRCTVVHEGPSRLRPWLSRHAFYGTTAGPLASRHPAALAPVSASAWTVAAWVLALARLPVTSLTAVAASILVLAGRLQGLVGEPVKVAAAIAGGGTAKSSMPALRGLTRAWAPALLLGLCFRRTRRVSAIALLAPAVDEWVAKPCALDPARFAALHALDDVAYGSGLWAGCLKARTVRPLLPCVTFRSRVWSSRSLRRQLSEHGGDGAIPREAP
ncbi:MAG TPA: mycofactocin biosynthesis glycosyltransferase MftF [Acidimicrobiales bacterium]|nr:mycofactocin biosynthesis glycosyltransferase MftF [Acidimicrobiales bacterium]